MCLIIVARPNGADLLEATLRKAWQANTDGAGYAFARDGKVVIKKPYFKLKYLLQDLREDYDKHGKASSFLIHFRLATHGDVSKKNTHPMRVSLLDGDIAMVHNGIISWFTDSDKESDTLLFTRYVLSGRYVDDVMSETFSASYENLLGCNKLAFLDGSGEVSIVNELLGHEIDGNWYSNLSWQYPWSRWGSKYPRYAKDEKGNWIKVEDGDDICSTGVDEEDMDFPPYMEEYKELYLPSKYRVHCNGPIVRDNRSDYKHLWVPNDARETARLADGSTKWETYEAISPEELEG